VDSKPDYDVRVDNKTINGEIEPEYRELGTQLALARRKAALTQREVAERAGIGRPTLANIENGRQRVLYHQFLDIAHALGADPRELLPAPTPPSPALEHLDDLQPPPHVVDWVRRGLARTGGHDTDSEG
jgi:transcriptional regulator with XRE-family HTH domain